MASRSTSQLHFVDTLDEPLKQVRVPRAVHPPRLPPARARRMLVTVPHDGNKAPARLLPHLDRDELMERHERERDQGARDVAIKLGSRLGLASVQVFEPSRELLDFGRHGGVSPSDREHLSKRAISSRLSEQLGPAQTEQLLQEGYDPAARSSHRLASQHFYLVDIHTYDVRDGRTGSERPEVEILQGINAAPRGSGYLPLFELSGSWATAAPTVSWTIQGVLHRRGIQAHIDWPYHLPTGAISARISHFWFARYLGQAMAALDATHPDLRELLYILTQTSGRDPGLTALWSHLSGEEPEDRDEARRLNRLAEAWRQVEVFLENHPDNVQAWHRDPHRPWAVSIEIRKDIAALPENECRLNEIIEALAEGLARAISPTPAPPSAT